MNTYMYHWRVFNSAGKYYWWSTELSTTRREFIYNRSTK